jgi:hypothetical protein
MTYVTNHRYKKLEDCIVERREKKLGAWSSKPPNGNEYFGVKLRSNGSVTPGLFSSRRSPMRLFLASLAFACALTPALARETKDGPTNEKAQKTYENALKDLQKKNRESALEKFKKADKQDDGHCLACQRQIVKYGLDYGDWKAAELAAEEIVGELKNDRDAAMAHYQLAGVLMEEGLHKHKDDLFARTHDELAKALAAYANFPAALYLDGRALAHLRQDEAAKARFEEYLKSEAGNDADRQRAKHFISRPELARARMAPPFELTTADGQRFSMDDLQGKVVLIDFWGIWCAPCRIFSK